MQQREEWFLIENMCTELWMFLYRILMWETTFSWARSFPQSKRSLSIDDQMVLVGIQVELLHGGKIQM